MGALARLRHGNPGFKERVAKPGARGARPSHNRARVTTSTETGPTLSGRILTALTSEGIGGLVGDQGLRTATESDATERNRTLA